MSGINSVETEPENSHLVLVIVGRVAREIMTAWDVFGFVSVEFKWSVLLWAKKAIKLVLV